MAQRRILREAPNRWACQDPCQWLAASRVLGPSSEWWSVFSFSSAKLQAMWAGWQSSTGAYPALIWDGWFKIITWAVKPPSYISGSFLLSPATLLWQTSLTDTFFTLKPTLSSGRPLLSASWCISIDFSCYSEWTKVTTMPGLRTPVSTWSTVTVSVPPFCRCPGGIKHKSLSGELVAGCNPERQAVWFHWNCHLYWWLCIPWIKALASCRHSSQKLAQMLLCQGCSQFS